MPATGPVGSRRGLVGFPGLNSEPHPVADRGKLWALALFLALLDSQLPLPQNWLKGQGILAPEKCNFIQVKLVSTAHPPWELLKILISAAPQGLPAHSCLG